MSAGPIELFDPVPVALKKIADIPSWTVQTLPENTGYAISIDGTLALVFGDKNPPSNFPKVVRWLEISSPLFRSENGLHVGMSVVEVIKLLPDAPLHLSALDLASEYFAPEAFQSCTEKGRPRTIFLLYVSSPKQLGREYTRKSLKCSSAESTHTFSHEGHISKIRIYDWQ